MRQPIDNLVDLEKRIADVNEKIAAKEEHLAELWHSLSEDDPKRVKQRHSSSLIQRSIAFAADSTEIIDGVIFGWRLYRRFSGTFSLFSRHKKKGKKK